MIGSSGCMTIPTLRSVNGSVRVTKTRGASRSAMRRSAAVGGRGGSISSAAAYSALASSSERRKWKSTARS